MKFKNKIVSATAGVLLLSLSLLSINQYLKVQDSVNELVAASINEEAESLAQNIANILDKKNQLARYAIDLIEDDISDNNIERIFTKQIIKQEFVLAGVGFESDGRILGNDPTWLPAASYDSRARPWYIEAKKRNDLTMTAPYADAVTKEIVVSLGIPMHSANEFVGAMFFDVSLAALGQKLNMVKPLGAGYVFLISDTGVFISHPQSEKNGKSITVHFDQELKINDEFQQLTIGGEGRLVKLEPVPNTDWLIGVSIPKSIITATADKLKNQAIVYSSGALVLGVLVLLFILGKLLAPLNNITAAMQDISSGDGDLTKRLSTDCDDEFSALADGFNQFVNKLQILITDSKKLSEKITVGTSEGENGASQSTEAISQQLLELEQLVSAMTQMSATSLEVSQYAQEAAASVSGVETSVEQGSKIVSGTSDSIYQLSSHIEEGVSQVKQLEEATQNIETILMVISGIAEQTNLLALNAAIEAARAGEQGRGFAVVADEVRNLAQRTQQSTAEIKSMIEVLQSSASAVASVMLASQGEAHNSVEQVRLANESLSSIGSEIAKITEMNFQIATAAEEQSLVSEEVNKNTNNIKALSEQVHDNALLTSDAMKNQTKITKQQHQVLSRFTI